MLRVPFGLALVPSEPRPHAYSRLYHAFVCGSYGKRGLNIRAERADGLKLAHTLADSRPPPKSNSHTTKIWSGPNMPVGIHEARRAFQNHPERRRIDPRIRAAPL